MRSFAPAALALGALTTVALAEPVTPPPGPLALTDEQMDRVTACEGVDGLIVAAATLRVILSQHDVRPLASAQARIIAKPPRPGTGLLCGPAVLRLSFGRWASPVLSNVSSFGMDRGRLPACSVRKNAGHG